MRDLQEHVPTINNQMSIIGADDLLKCKLIKGTLTKAILCWDIGLPKHYMTSYQDFAKKTNSYVFHQEAHESFHDEPLQRQMGAKGDSLRVFGSIQ